MGVVEMAVVYYRKIIARRLYPVKARDGPYAFAHEVRRIEGKVKSRYIGIRRVPEGVVPDVVERERPVVQQLVVVPIAAASQYAVEICGNCGSSNLRLSEAFLNNYLHCVDCGYVNVVEKPRAKVPVEIKV